MLARSVALRPQAPVSLRSVRAQRKNVVVRAEVDSKMTIGEKEALFLEALRSFYFEGKPNMSNEEFDQLKQDLLWEGSKVAILTSDEQRFLEASVAFQQGKPIMSDEDFDKLKKRLLEKGSDITVSGPRCSLRSGKMYADATPDYLRMLSVNVPAALVVLGFVFAIDYLTNFSITYLVELPKPFGFLFLWTILFPSIFALSTGITGFVLRDWVIVKAPCPNCGAENSAFFGDIFTVAGPRATVDVDCASCQSQLRFDNQKRTVSVERVGPAPAPAGKKKKAAAAEE